MITPPLASCSPSSNDCWQSFLRFLKPLPLLAALCVGPLSPRIVSAQNLYIDGIYTITYGSPYYQEIRVGYSSSGSILNVLNTNTLLSNSGTLYVGWGWPSEGMVISNGATVASADTILGYASSAGGNKVLVTGSNSLLSNSASMIVGRLDGGNTLTISNGGRVVDANGTTGYLYSSQGPNAVLVTGIGSLWSNSVSLILGRSVSDSLTVANGGKVSVGGVGELTVGSQSILNIGSLGGSDSAGFIEANTIALGAGVINFNQTNSTTLTSSVSGGGSVNQRGVGTTTLTGSNSYTGTTTISAGFLQVGNGGTNGALGSGSVVDNTSLIVNRSDAITISNAISGTGSLTQLGVGTTTLTGSNSYSGVTTISAGTLDFGSKNSLYGGSNSLWTAANLTVASNAAVAFGVGGASGFTTSNITTLLGNLSTVSNNGLMAGSAIGFDTTGGAFTLTNSVANSVGVGGGSIGLAKLGTATLTITGSNSYTGGTLISAGTLALGAADRLADTGAVTVNSGTFDLGGFSETVGSVMITSGTIANGTLTGSSYAMQSGSVSATLAGSGTLTKIGVGTVTLSGSNSYSGVTTISAGTLEFANQNSLYGGSNSLWTAANLTVSSNATIAFGIGGASGFTTSNITMLLGNLSTVNNNGLKAGSAIGFDITGGAFTLTNAVADSVGTGGGTVGLAKLGTGTMIITGSNIYTGGTTISAGTLALGAANRLADAGAVTVNGGAFDLGGFSETVGTVTLSSGTIGNGTLTGSSYGVQSGSVSASLAGSGTLTKSGAGTVTLSGSNSYSGGTTISAGTLALGAANLLYDSGVITVNGGTFDLGGFSETVGSVTLTSGTIGNGTLTGSSYAVQSGSVSAALAGSGALTKTGGGTVTLSGGNNYVGTTTISAGSLQVGNGGATGTLGSGAVVDNGSLALNRSDAITISNAISGTGAFTQFGIGTTTLTGSNNYSGITTISTGALEFANQSALYGGSNSLWTAANLTVASNATVAFGVGGASGFTTSNITTLLGNLSTVSNNGLTAGSMIAFDTTGGAFTLTNAVANSTGTGGGSIGLTKLGTGTLSLTGSNSYSGGTTISAGTLQVGNGGSMGNLGSGSIVDNASLAFTSAAGLSSNNLRHLELERY